MPITQNSVRAYYGLQGTMEYGEFDTTGTGTVGPSQSSVGLLSDRVYSFMAEVDGAGSVTIDLDDGTAAQSGSGVPQLETATAAGTIGTSGNAAVVVTGDDIAGSPITLSVAVVSGDTAATWAGKVRTALNSNAAITSKYAVGGSTTAITLERTPARYNDPTLNISLANGTCTGITAAPTSANTTAGVNPSRALRLTGKQQAGEDAQGASLGTMQDIQGVFVRKVAGDSSAPVEIFDSLGLFKGTLYQTGTFLETAGASGLTNDGTTGETITIQPVSDGGYSKVYITIAAAT
jgi:phage tail sheath gpL-like